MQTFPSLTTAPFAPGDIVTCTDPDHAGKGNAVVWYAWDHGPGYGVMVTLRFDGYPYPGPMHAHTVPAADLHRTMGA